MFKWEIIINEKVKKKDSKKNTKIVRKDVWRYRYVKRRKHTKKNLMCKLILILLKWVCEKKNDKVKKKDFVLNNKVKIE